MTRPPAVRSPLSLGGLLVLCLAATAPAGITPAPIFGDHMVLQAGVKAPVFGAADPGEKVIVTLSKKVGPSRYDDGVVAETVAGDDGRWRVDVGPVTAGEELTIAVTAADGTTVTFTDVLAGDVWLCSGQSNMQWELRNTLDADREIKAAKDDRVRLFSVPRHNASEPQTTLQGEPGQGEPSAARWVKLTPEAAGQFSAVGYHFGTTIHEATGRPVGLIDSSWGGTPSEAWTRTQSLEPLKTAGPLLGRWADTEQTNRPHHRPGVLNNGMIAPLVPFALKGAIWYQGESNAGRAEQYDEIFPAMIEDWRDQFGQDLPFFWVQLANYMAYNEDANAGSAWAELREAQDKTLDELENVGQAVILDVGEARDIHPRNKEDVGERLALAALETVYQLDGAGRRSPRFKSVVIAGAAATITFDVAGDRLQNRRDDYQTDPAGVLGFAVAGADRKFYRATAEITGPGTVKVTAPAQVPEIVSVRYGWADNPRVTLFNTRGLPAAPFRTDDWPGVTDGKYLAHEPSPAGAAMPRGATGRRDATGCRIMRTDGRGGDSRRPGRPFCRASDFIVPRNEPRNELFDVHASRTIPIASATSSLRRRGRRSGP